MKLIWYIFVFYILISCSGSPEPPAQHLEKAGYTGKNLLNKLKSKKVKQQFTPPEALYVVQNELVVSPLGLGPRSLPTDIHRKYGNGFREEIYYPKNKQQKQVLDVVVLMHRNDNKLRLHNGILVAAELVNNEIDIQKGIRVGMSKASFSKKFTDAFKDSVPDVVQVGNNSRTAYFTFSFADDTLSNIRYTSVY
ncbi:MAG: hypothetical protein LPJ89_06960 [Hymenobacteraceae bacterium]|nr:hypothetical protein [Hymenobacteraceae bacterium]MDX5395037.1 hypothetical protein [Hymenobacteraceae bacterium]MDX5443507.1 hypothetical protein [Hymenobacteraceae bacterium]MDX5511071.1 hypothetical protein [Hymenobacteraceae bacterium]